MKREDVKSYLNEILLENGVSEDVKEIYSVSYECDSEGGGIVSENWVSRESWLEEELRYWDFEIDDVICFEEFGIRMVGGFGYWDFKVVSEGEVFEESDYVRDNNLKGVIKSSDMEYGEVWFYVR